MAEQITQAKQIPQTSLLSGVGNKVITTLSGTFFDTGEIAGPSNKLELTLDYVNIFRQFKSEGGGAIFFSGREQAGIVRNTSAGTNIFYKPIRLVTSPYTDNVTGILPTTIQTPGAETIEIFVDKEQGIQVYYDIATLAQMGASIEDAGGGNVRLNAGLVARGQANMMQAKLLYLSAKATSGIITYLKNTSGKIITINVKKKDAADDLPSIDEARNKIWATIVNKRAELKNKLTASSIGTDELVLMVSTKMMNYLVQATTLFSDSSREALLESAQKSITRIGGIPVKVVNWLGVTTKASKIAPGQTGADGQAIDTAEAFDFTGVNAIIGPAGYVGYFPGTEVQPITTVQLQASRNIYTSCRFKVPSTGAKVIYPAFIQGYNFNLVAPTYTGPVKARNVAVPDPNEEKIKKLQTKVAELKQQIKTKK